MSETPRDPRTEWTDAERAALERLRATPPPDDLEDAIVDALAGEGLVGPRVPARRAWGWVALAAAACVAAFLAGRAVSERGAGAGPAETPGTYLVLLYEDAGFEAPATPEAHAALVEEYSRWAAELRERGIEVTGEELGPADEAAWLTRRGGAVVATEGTPEGAAGTLSGFYVLEAPSAAAAVAIARTVPHLRHGGTVVVRGVVEH